MNMLSLFDGSGGFPLAGVMCGIVPKYASEIEPFPIRVTTKRFPYMKHLGDVSKINGADIEPVEVVTFGSPCQDLSIAGKREGIKVGTRSGLFLEAIRIIREMRQATNGKYPIFAVWENVFGAFSSNKGKDFGIVLEQFENTARGENKKSIHVPKPPKGKWLKSGEIVGQNYSVAWRTFNAQYWGVPQNRRRIYLVADFRGKRAGKILFEREGLQGNYKKIKKTWNRITERNKNSVNEYNKKRYLMYPIENHGQDSRIKINSNKVFNTLTSNMGTGGNNVPLVLCMYSTCIDRTYKSGFNGNGVKNNVSCTLTTADRHAVLYKNSQNCNDYVIRRITPKECARLQGFPDWWTDDLKTDNPSDEELQFWRKVFETYRTTVTKSKKQKSDNQILKWLKNPYSDTALYKMWGNGIALPNAYYVMYGISKELRKEQNNKGIENMNWEEKRINYLKRIIDEQKIERHSYIYYNAENSSMLYNYLDIGLIYIRGVKNPSEMNLKAYTRNINEDDSMIDSVRIIVSRMANDSSGFKTTRFDFDFKKLNKYGKKEAEDVLMIKDKEKSEVRLLDIFHLRRLIKVIGTDDLKICCPKDVRNLSIKFKNGKNQFILMEVAKQDRFIKKCKEEGLYFEV